MAQRAKTDFAEAWRAVGFSEAELVEYLGSNNYSLPSIKHMSGGRTPVPEHIVDMIAEVALLLEEGGVIPPRIPEGPRRRHEIVKGLRDRAARKRKEGNDV